MGRTSDGLKKKHWKSRSPEPLPAHFVVHCLVQQPQKSPTFAYIRPEQGALVLGQSWSTLFLSSSATGTWRERERGERERESEREWRRKHLFSWTREKKGDLQSFFRLTMKNRVWKELRVPFQSAFSVWRAFCPELHHSCQQHPEAFTPRPFRGRSQAKPQTLFLLIVGLAKAPKRRRIKNGNKLVFSVGEWQKCSFQFARRPAPFARFNVCTYAALHDVLSNAMTYSHKPYNIQRGSARYGILCVRCACWKRERERERERERGRQRRRLK